MALNEIPKLPERVSNDGRQIWDWAGKLSKFIQRQDRKRELRQKIAEIQRQCGSCQYWMTRSCPREKPNNQTGRWEGPSVSDIICGKFAMKAWSDELMEKWKAELAALEGRE